MRAWIRSLGVLLFSISAFVLPATAADYPTKPIRLVVPYGPGGGTDVIARVVAAELSKRLGQPIVVDNRPGAESFIGSDYVARAAPDGYTLLVGASGLVSGPVLLKSFTLEPIKDLTHVVQFAEAPPIFVVNASFPAKSIKDFIALAKANPGKYNIAVFGPYAFDNALFNAMAGISTTPVPFQTGTGQMVAALLGNQVQGMFISPIAVKGQLEAGQLRVIGIGSARRHSTFPDVPAIAETVPGFSASSLWEGLSGPVGLPDSIISKLNAETNEVLKSEEVKSRFGQLGFSAVGGTPEEYRDMIQREVVRFQKAAQLNKPPSQ